MMPALKDGHNASRSQGPGNIPARDAVQSSDSINPEVIVKLKLDVVDPSAVNRLVARSDFAVPPGVRKDDRHRRTTVSPSLHVQCAKGKGQCEGWKHAG
jgi:hypothetical protein